MNFSPAFWITLLGIFWLTNFWALTQFVYHERDHGWRMQQFWGLPAWYMFEKGWKADAVDEAGHIIYYSEHSMILFPELIGAICVALVPGLLFLMARKFWLNKIRFRLGTLLILMLATAICVHGNIYLILPDSRIAPGWPITESFLLPETHKMIGNGAVGLCILFAGLTLGEFLFPVKKDTNQTPE
jgi:hypothetical protein